MDELVKHRILELSTAHLQPTTLSGWLPQIKAHYPSSYIDYPFGWILSASFIMKQLATGDGEMGVPVDVEECCSFAVAQGCNYVMFDGDAACVTMLTNYSEAYE
jgi:hypothetical protein